MSGFPRSGVVGIDLGTGAVDKVRVDTDGPVRAMATGRGQLYIGGGFRTIMDQSRAGVAAMDLGSETVTEWDPGVDGSVWSISAMGDAVYIGGVFGMVSGERRNNVAGVDARTGKCLAWTASADAAVWSISRASNDVAIGGDFASVGLSPQSGAALIEIEHRMMVVERDGARAGTDDRGAAGVEVGPIAPNPCSARVRIAFGIASSAVVRVEVFDIEGRVQRTLINRSCAAGEHMVEWDCCDWRATPVRPGVYVCRVSAGSCWKERKVVVSGR